MEAPDFWDDPEKSQSKMKELKSMKDDVATYAKLKEQYEDIETMIEMGYEENDESLIPEIQQMLDDLRAHMTVSELRLFCRENMINAMRF